MPINQVKSSWTFGRAKLLIRLLAWDSYTIYKRFTDTAEERQVSLPFKRSRLICDLGKKRYEIACYKNKVLEWRSGVETDLDNVLQIPSVFLSLSKGQTAPAADLAKSFGAKMSVNDIVLEILNKGELQVGEKERNAELDRLHAEVLDIVAGKLVDPKTKRVYTTGMIEKSLAEISSQGSQAGADSKGTTSATGSGTATPSGDEPKSKAKEATWTGVVTSKSAKSQALEAMKALIAHQPIPLARARMRLRIVCATSILKQPAKSAHTKIGDGDDSTQGEKPKGTVKDRILSFVEQIESQDTDGGEWEAVGFVEPGDFKRLSDFLAAETRGKGRAEVLDMAVMHEDI
ncbi:MAG: hypothetical protein M1814_005565 [Vezdaea aestivalis]|nr:MAG: hypothetical protein M1814_005565 [Vezdaea aestivalis]